MTMPPLLYERLAEELGQLIAQRVFTSGERLPSIRQLALQKRLSISTVMQAMRLLEDRGLIDAKPQSGFYVRHRNRAHARSSLSCSVQKPAYVGINNTLMQVLEAHEQHGTVALGSALPPPEMLPINGIKRTLASIAKRGSGLLANPGYFEINEPNLLRQILRRAAAWGAPDKEEIVVTASCTEAISLCLRAVTKPGDTVAVESATYFVLLQLLESLGLKALEIPMNGEAGPSLDALELSLREGLCQACLLVPNVSNPVGSIMPDASKKRLAELVSRYDIPLIEDDIYGDLCFSAQRPAPVKAFDASGNVLSCSSFSKTISPALRVGYVMAGKYAERVRFLKTVSSGASSHLPQAAVADFLSGSGYDKQLRAMRRLLSQRIARMSDAIASSFPEPCYISEPKGGFVLWIQLPEPVDAFELHAAAIRKGIAFMPGPLFSASGRLRDHMRINCANPWSDAIADGIRDLGELIASAADCARKRSA
jgi:DNA-binding transcriptional MocR family regulator